MELRDYQKQAVESLRGWLARNPEGSPLLVLPTGAGKSLIIAEIARRICGISSDKRVLILAHRKELLEQNAKKLQELVPGLDVGVCSAGLKKRQVENRVVIAGIQSVHSKAAELGFFNMCMIDEAHLIPMDERSMYRKLITGLRESNPKIRFCGLTATPYRLGSGMLAGKSDRHLFTDIAYEVGILELIEKGYLARLKSKGTLTRTNLSGVRVRGGEFVQNEMEAAFNQTALVEASVEEIISLAGERKSWLVFASGIKHAEAVQAALQARGVLTGIVTSSVSSEERQQQIEGFRTGKFKALVNCDVLTTGFDYPSTDLIAVLRATKSHCLWVQICGRGARTAPDKTDCLILDFGENALRLGPVDRIRVARSQSGEPTVRTQRSRQCPECQTIIPMSAKECMECGHFIVREAPRVNHTAEASDGQILSTDPKVARTVAVRGASFSRYKSRMSAPPTLRMELTVELRPGYCKNVSKWLAFDPESKPTAKEFAKKWWQGLSLNGDNTPGSVEEALNRVDELFVPKKVTIAQNDDGYWEIKKVLELYSPEESRQLTMVNNFYG